MSQQRERNQNFTTKEEEILLMLLEKYGTIITTKKSDAHTWDEKNKTWQKLCEEFNMLGAAKRTVKQLKLKYENLKKKAKKENSEIQKEIYLTGGGTIAKNCVITPISEKCLGLMGSSATGLESIFNSDEVEVTAIRCDLEAPKSLENIIQVDNLDDSQDWSSWKPTLLRNPVSQKLVKEDEISTSKKKSTEKHLGKRKLSENFGNHKIKMLKAQEEFYKNEEKRAAEIHELEIKRRALMIDAMEKDIQIKIEEQSRAAENHDWERKQHKLKIENMELENQIKKKQLQNLI